MERSKDCNIIFLPELSSTNEYARELLRHERPPEGTIILTDHQTAGRGQDGSSWESEAGKNILASMILYPTFLDPARQFVISMMTALGIIDFLRGIIPAEELFIKWPNDIYAGKHKIGGILINNELMGGIFEYSIAGVGININQLSFPEAIPNPVSLALLSGEQYDIREEAKRLCDCIKGRYNQLKLGDTRQTGSDYLDSLLGLERWREYIFNGQKIKAKITGVSEYGKLQLETSSGSIECDLKEIEYVF